jgi:hypothetical protein
MFFVLLVLVLVLVIGPHLFTFHVSHITHHGMDNPADQPAERRNGKVARLPKPTRDRINTMIQDGIPYLEIIERLGPEGAALNETNLSRWKSGGYMDWLRELHLTEALKAKHELAMAIVSNSPEANGSGRAVLQIIAANLCEFLAETDPATLRESLLSDADKFTRFVNAMVRLAEGGIKCELHKFRHEDRAVELARQTKSTETPGVSPESLQTAEQKLKLL